MNDKLSQPTRWENILPSIDIGDIKIKALNSLPQGNLKGLPENAVINIAWGQAALLEITSKNSEGVEYKGILMAVPGEEFTRNSFLTGGFVSSNMSLTDVYTEFYQNIVEDEALTWRFNSKPLDGGNNLRVDGLPQMVLKDGTIIEPFDDIEEFVKFLDYFKGPEPMFTSIAQAWERARNGECILLAIKSEHPALAQVWLNHEGWGMQIMRTNNGENKILPKDNYDDDISTWIGGVSGVYPNGPPALFDDQPISIEIPDANGNLSPIASWQDEASGLLFSPVRSLQAAASLLSRTSHFTRCTGKHATLHERGRPNLQALLEGKEALVMVEGPAGVAGSISINRETGGFRWSFGSWILEGMVEPNTAKKAATTYLRDNLIEVSSFPKP